jgi:signal transduction histidine kinase/ligand-binding sensor domain-containing protein/CheY-like chemotaxis protein
MGAAPVDGGGRICIGCPGSHREGMVRGLKLILIAVGLMVGQARAEAPAPEAAWERIVPPVFTHLTPAEGLPYPVAMAMAQDGHGFLWFATPGGLARWDGYRLQVFRHEDGGPTSLPENIITLLHTDRQGQLWLATASGVVARYDEASTGFVAYRDQGSALGRLLDMAADESGGLWVVGRQGVARLDTANGTWGRPGNAEGLPAGEAASVMVDRSGAVWIGTAQGLMRRRNGDATFRPVAISNEMAGQVITALAEDRQGGLWFGTRRGAVGEIDPAGSQTLWLPPSGHRIAALAEIRPGVLWAAEFGGGLRELRPAMGGVRRFVNDPAVARSLANNSMTGLLVDRSGVVWTSSLGGVSRHIQTNDRLMTIIPAPGGLSAPDVRSVAAALDGRLWLGYRSGGLTLLDPKANAVHTMQAGPQPGLLPEGGVQAMADAGDGTLWVGLPSGLFKVREGKAEPFQPLGQADILALHQDESGLWVGGTMGLAHVASEGTPPRVYRRVQGDKTSLSDASVMALHRDRAGRLWAGTQRGLNRLDDPQQGMFRQFLKDPQDPESLPSDIINDIGEDASGRLWLATASGIGILDPSREGKAVFRRLGTAQGLPHDTVLSVTQAVDGRMLVGTGGGLALIDPETLAIRLLGPAEGAQIGTYWAGAAARISDGTVVVGGFGGVAVVRPGDLPLWTYVPAVMVSSVRVGGALRPAEGPILVEPDERGFRVEFASSDFSAPERNQYSYRLAGYDDAWTQVGSHGRLAAYTNLSPGTYTLEIAASNSAGQWTPEPLKLEFRVLPAWFQTLWFRILMVALGLAVLLAAFHWRRRYFERRERELVHLVEERTAEAEAARRHALAGQEEARKAKEEAEIASQVKSRLLAILGHELRTPLNGLLGVLQLLDHGAAETERRKLLTTALGAGNTLSNLIESLLEYGRDGADLPAPPAPLELRRSVTEAVDLLHPQVRAKGLEFSLAIHPAGQLWVLCDGPKVLRILFNLLSNAIKFTERGGITVSVDVSERLTITVCDTGIGIGAEMQEEVFGEFIQGDDSITRRYGGVGLGLAVSRRMAMLMGGQLSVDSEPGRGSRFCLDLPVSPCEPLLAQPPTAFIDVALRVLVIDDDEINREVAGRMLRVLGHDVETMASGMDALALIAMRRFDVVLLDLHMPDMDGFEIARRMGATVQGAPFRIFSMSADLSQEALDRCRALGMAGAITKPVRLESLRRTLSGSAGMTPPGPAGDLVDSDLLCEHADLLGGAELIRLARLFQRTSRTLIEKLGQAVACGDRPMIASLAHRLCSAAGQSGRPSACVRAARRSNSPRVIAICFSPHISSRRVRSRVQVPNCRMVWLRGDWLLGCRRRNRARARASSSLSLTGFVT